MFPLPPGLTGLNYQVDDALWLACLDRAIALAQVKQSEYHRVSLNDTLRDAEAIYQELPSTRRGDQ